MKPTDLATGLTLLTDWSTPHSPQYYYSRGALLGLALAYILSYLLKIKSKRPRTKKPSEPEKKSDLIWY